MFAFEEIEVLRAEAFDFKLTAVTANEVIL
jgi:hypothetical protein